MILFRPSVEVRVGSTVALNADHEGPRISFSVARSMDPEPDAATIEIFNLNPSRVDKMLYEFEGGAKVQIRCGYDGELSHLFSGRLREAVQETTGIDKILRIRADDGGDEIDEVTVQVSSLGLSASNMVDLGIAAYRRAGKFLTKHASVDVTILAAGISANADFWTTVSLGSVSQLFDQAARLCEARWYVRDDELYFARRGLPVDGRAVELPRQTWLSTPRPDPSGLWRFDTFCLPQILPGRQLILIGRKNLAGRDRLRAESTYHAGDTESGPWRASISARNSP